MFVYLPRLRQHFTDTCHKVDCPPSEIIISYFLLLPFDSASKVSTVEKVIKYTSMLNLCIKSKINIENALLKKYFQKNILIFQPFQHILLHNTLFYLYYIDFLKSYLFKYINYFKGKNVLQHKIVNIFVC